MGVNNELIEGTNTIQDDVTSTTLGITNTQVALYALGKSANNGYARFTTSPIVPTWAAGATAPIGNCAQGSLYSCTGGTVGAGSCLSGATPYALWGCPVPGGNWSHIK
jgi:hypothetical protein